MATTKSRMTPFRCPNEVYERVRETMAKVKPEINGRMATLTDVIIVALNEWCDSKWYYQEQKPRKKRNKS